MVASQNEVKHVPAGTGPVYYGPGDQLRFLLTGAETGGTLFIAETLVPPGGGPPPHLHRREDESFYIQEGALTFQVGGRTIQALPGDLVHAPRGIAHSFRNTGSVNARMLVTVTPAGLENYFRAVFDPASDPAKLPPPPSEAMLARIAVTAPKYGLEIVAPE